MTLHCHKDYLSFLGLAFSHELRTVTQKGEGFFVVPLDTRNLESLTLVLSQFGQSYNSNLPGSKHCDPSICMHVKTVKKLAAIVWLKFFSLFYIHCNCTLHLQRSRALITLLQLPYCLFWPASYAFPCFSQCHHHSFLGYSLPSQLNFPFFKGGEGHPCKEKFGLQPHTIALL